MARKIVSMIILSIFILFDLNCITYIMQEESISKILNKPTRKKTNTKIIMVSTKTGKEYSFPWETPACIIKDSITGTTVDFIRVSIPTSDVDQIMIRKIAKKPMSIILPLVILTGGVVLIFFLAGS